MTREEQIRSAAYEASMTEETIVREEVIKDGVQVGYKDIKLRDSDRPIARLFFRKGVEWADANQPNPWISVEERLPEINRNSYSNIVLTIDENQNIVVAFYSFYRREWIRVEGKENIDDSISQNDITHWMPIPELPKEDGV